MTALDRVLDLLRARGPVTQRGAEWTGLCPAHDDTVPSLDVRAGDGGRVLFQCRSHHCTVQQIARALGLSVSDLFDAPPNNLTYEDRVERAYEYRDEGGRVLFQAVRLKHPKDFRQRRWEGGRWVWNLDGVRRVVYRLPELLAAPADATVYVVEGEKDADALAAAGLVATTNPMGAGKWRPEYAAALAGRRVVVLPDNDDAGKRHAAQVRDALQAVAASVAVVELPGLPPKGDVSDWLGQGGNDAAGLVELVREVVESRGWPAPIPLEDARVPPPDFPAGCLPPALEEFVASVAEAVAVPVDYPAAFLLGAAAGLIGATLELAIDQRWRERPVLYVCVVAPKSSGKSPAFDAVMHPINREQALRTHRGDGGPVFIEETTVEGLPKVLKKHPRGLLLADDELSGWVASFNQYKQGLGGDRKFWLKAWNGRSRNVLRANKDAPHVYVPIVCVSVVGGVQPAVVEEFRGRQDDGFLERVLFSYPDPLPAVPYTWPEHRGSERWREVAGRLLAREMEPGDYGPRPFVVGLSADAREAFGAWTAEIAAALNDPDRDPALDGVLGKLKGTSGRLALVCYALRCAADGQGVLGDLPGRDMEAGIRLARYFLAHTARVHGIAVADGRKAGAAKVLKWLRAAKKPVPALTRRDAFRALRRQFQQGSEELIPPLKLLVNHGFLRYAENPGRSEAVYEVHPSLLSPPSPAVTRGGDGSSAHGPSG